MIVFFCFLGFFFLLKLDGAKFDLFNDELNVYVTMEYKPDAAKYHMQNTSWKPWWIGSISGDLCTTAPYDTFFNRNITIAQ